jgi:protein arginine kinase activator
MEHKCTFCKTNVATCHLTKIVNGKAIEIHVCDECIPEIKDQNLADFDIWEAVAKLAEEKGMPDPALAIEPPEEEEEEISAKSLLIPGEGVEGSGLTCPVCGFTSENLRKTGRLGCPNCYETFSEMLGDVFSDCQKSGHHTGKVPARLAGLKKKRLEELLEQAISREQYEEAAVIRDQLKAL